MEVLSYQLFFIIFISLSSLFGKTARNWVVILSVVFTFFAVFTSGLMIIQFISIGIGFLISESIGSKIENNKEATDSCVGGGCIIIFIALIILFIYSTFFDTKNYVKPKPKNTIEIQKTNEKVNSSSRKQKADSSYKCNFFLIC